MAERWMQERESRREALYRKAQRSGRQADIAEWERYVRQTARMQSLASFLESRLPASFAKTTGRRVLHKGRELYLEHVVVGPSGIYLIESAEASPQWRDDLARSMAFFQENLGPESRRFTCLVIARDQEGLDRLPPGVQLVESIEAVLHLVTAEPTFDPLPPAIAQEMWQILQLMESREPITDGRPAQIRLPTWQQLKARLPSTENSFLRRATWREGVTLGAALLMSLLLTNLATGGFQGGFWLITLLVTVPFTAFWIAIVLLMPWRDLRVVFSSVLMVLALFVVLVTAMVLIWERQHPQIPGVNQAVQAHLVTLDPAAQALILRR